MKASAPATFEALPPEPAATGANWLLMLPNPAQRRDSTTLADRDTAADTATAPMALVTIRPVWSANCSATVDLARLAGPRTGVWRLPHHFAHLVCAALPCDLGRADCKFALYQRCLTIGTPYDIYSWLNLPDLVEQWPLLVLPGGLKAEWTGALRDAGLLARQGRAVPGPKLPAIQRLSVIQRRVQ